ncbi:TetR/AcrR family transcriptional regulator [Saccharopolyspora sp. ASAGF58]|uniref:TetR/AcrR family transcriptional regulator n=1 Tax=Saccharopolyspora sp. ASAGF58 TaxID=2719023 RepID=UPI0014483736|nr:TetR/AcrR family transcriptional regulator [Saccharopolyspora sp. ASAGF58]
MRSARGKAGVTRQQILVVASRLFAERGFYGTSTREISEAVGIRQPSLYSHFATKHLLLAELIDLDLRPALHRLARALELDGPVAARLHAFLHADVAAVLRLPFDVRCLYNDDALRTPELQEQARRRDELHQLTCRLVQQGVASGELAADPVFVQRAITGLLLEVMRERGASVRPAPDDRAVDVADFVLRATLADPLSLVAVRVRSADLLADIAGRRAADLV